MIRVVVSGATGKLGRLVCQKIIASEDMELVGGLVSPTGPHYRNEIYPGIIGMGISELPRLLENCDVYVDLTNPAAAERVISDVPISGVNMVVGTTAINKYILDETEKNVAASNTAAIISSNFAIGVNVFWKMCEIMARYMPDYDIEVIEMHHNAKKDAPSGTAAEAVKRLSEAADVQDLVYGRRGVTGPRGKEIGIHSIRAGDIVGDHTVMFAKNNERIELTHRAISREAFADGCIEAIRWIADKKDGKMHTMQEVLGL